MEIRFTAEQEAWRGEVREFLDKELPPEKEFNHEFEEDPELWDFARAFTRKIGERGWIGLTWPKEYGGLERTPIEKTIMMEEFAYREAPMVNMIGWGLAAGSLLVGGSHEQKLKFLPAIANMETFWAEGLTEPNAGSDLASLQTSAVRDGDYWVINGQKTYTTWGTHADVLYLAVRTNPDVPKHKGISVFCLDLKLPGISFSPLYNLGGGRQNHTYLDNVRIPDDMMVGEEGMGWYYIMNAFYGGGGGYAGHAKYQRMLDDVVAYCNETTRYGKPLIKDPAVRHELADLAITVETLKLLTYEGLSAAKSSEPPAFGGAMGVVISKEAQPLFAQAITRIVGPMSQVKKGKWAPLAGHAEEWYRGSFANHAGGTSQVKRMVLATRGLGLPR